MKQKKLNFNRIYNKKLMKQMIIAFSSALVIGTFFGLFILQMIKQTDEDNTHVVQPAEEIAGDLVDEKQFETITVSVIQAGVFTDNVNAKNWELKFENAGISTMNWVRGEETYLLVGLFNGKDKGISEVEKMKDLGLEVFRKEWEVSGKLISLSNEEYEWLREFLDVWQESLALVEEGKMLIYEDWESLMHGREAYSEQISALSDAINELIIKDAVKTLAQDKMILLQLLNKYELI